MSQQPPDEEFERRLRDVLHSRSLGVPVPPDAIDRIHAGARRRQQRRSATAALGAVAVIAVVAGAIGLGSGGHGSTATASKRTPSTSTTPTGIPLPLVIPASESPGDLSSPPVAASSAGLASPPSSAVPTVAPAAPTPYPSAGSAVPADFTPVSVTAVNDKTYWVLGTQLCGSVACTAIVNTIDAGAHFTEIAPPHAATINVDNTTRPVFNLRFADSDNGWAYGDALWTTADGGATWADTSLPAGSVKDLEAARNPGAAAGTAWAVVQPTGGGNYELWQAPYATGSGTGSWQQVDLGTDPPGDTSPSLVVKGATAYLLGADAKKVERVYVASVGVATTTYAAPCYPVGAAFSAGIGSLWTACPSTGTSPGGATVSTDGGATWHAAASPSKITVGVVGGIDATTAVVDEGSNLVVVSTTGKPKTATISSKNANFSFLGFTDAKVGYALGQAPNQLWRTTDGGATWSAVVF
jgi:photosystem II stability/assembly factor-like uncharacterized protein